MKDLHWKPVTSSNIEALALMNATMFVRFKGGKVYSYANVTPPIFAAVSEAESVGKAFQTQIKAKPTDHPFALVG